MLKDLKEKKEELETSYSAAKEYLKINKQRVMEQFDMKLEQKITDKVEEFRK